METPPGTVSPAPAQGQPPQIRRMDKCRIAVVEYVYHQQPDVQPTVTESRFSRWLESQEQPYLRRLTLDQTWRELDFGWLKQSGMLVLKNEEGRFHVQPTKDEREDMAARIIEVALFLPGEKNDGSRTMHDTPLRKAIGPLIFAIVRPGESLRFEPHDVGCLRIRTMHGSARCSIMVLPH